MNLDITFCSNVKCKNMDCDRNQENVTKYYVELSKSTNIQYFFHKPISIADFKECEYWKE